MKEFFKFLQWRWKTWQTWQSLFVLAMLLQIVALFIPVMICQAIWILGFSVPAFFLIKWFIWETAKESWHKYKEDRNQLLTTIKDSDK